MNRVNRFSQLTKNTWLRRCIYALVLVIIVATIASYIFNAVTAPPYTVAAPNGNYVKANDIMVHYREWGTSGPAIVLVHGFLESTFSWNKVAPLLASHGYRVYAIDLAGYGYTEYSGHYSLQAEADDVYGTIQALHIPRPVLVGHSLGAAVVGVVALDHSTDIAKVIFADGDGLPSHPGSALLRGIIVNTTFFTTVYRLALDDTAFDHSLISHICGPSCPANTVKETKGWIAPLKQRAAEDALKTIITHGVIGLSAAQIQSITIPRAIIWGRDDTSAGGSLKGVEKNLHHPQVVIIPHAGHLSMLANPSAFAKAVLEEATN